MVEFEGLITKQSLVDPDKNWEILRQVFQAGGSSGNSAHKGRLTRYRKIFEKLEKKLGPFSAADILSSLQSIQEIGSRGKERLWQGMEKLGINPLLSDYHPAWYKTTEPLPDGAKSFTVWGEAIVVRKEDLSDPKKTYTLLRLVFVMDPEAQSKLASPKSKSNVTHRASLMITAGEPLTPRKEDDRIMSNRKSLEQLSNMTNAELWRMGVGRKAIIKSFRRGVVEFYKWMASGDNLASKDIKTP